MLFIICNTTFVKTQYASRVAYIVFSVLSYYNIQIRKCLLGIQKPKCMFYRCSQRRPPEAQQS